MALEETFAVNFPDCINIVNISEAHETLLGAVNRGEDFEIDLRNLTDIDLTFIQLIESARRSMAERGLSLRLVEAANGVVAQVLRRGGFLDPADGERTDFWLQGTSKQ